MSIDYGNGIATNEVIGKKGSKSFFLKLWQRHGLCKSFIQAKEPYF